SSSLVAGRWSLVAGRWSLVAGGAASALGGAEARRRQRGRDRGGLLLQQRERLGDPAGQLRVLARDPGVRRQRHLDVRLHAVVLDLPVLALEPAGVLRLGDAGAVDEVVAAVDADHAAPGAGADDWPDLEGAGDGVHDVAV